MGAHRHDKRQIAPSRGWAPCKYCGYCHYLEAWAAYGWHEQHDASMGLVTTELHTQLRTEER